jgi:uncharacterized Zn finger protein
MTYDYGDDMPSEWSVAPSAKDRRKKADARKAELISEGRALCPITITGNQIAKTFWGKAWCHHLEKHHDYENRLPRGKTYVRSGCVVDLKISQGLIQALVEGEDLYEVSIRIQPLEPHLWQEIIEQTAGSIHSILELLEGKLTDRAIEIFTDPRSGVFPLPTEVKMACTCPDWATVCKHVAATLYGVGHRLDHQPELFFVLRSIDQNELIRQVSQNFGDELAVAAADLDFSEIEDLFGIEIDQS